MPTKGIVSLTAAGVSKKLKGFCGLYISHEPKVWSQHKSTNVVFNYIGDSGLSRTKEVVNPVSDQSSI